MCAEKNSAGEEGPGDHGPAAGDVDPLLAGILHDQRAQREGKRHGEADIAEIKHGRMNHHLGILQQRIQAAAVGADRAFEQAERIGGEVQQQQKENLHARQNHRGVGEEARIGLVAQAQNESIGGEQQRPEQQRTFLAGPQHGELIRTGKIAVAVVEDVSDGEVVVEGADDEDDGGEKDSRRKWRCRRGARVSPDALRSLGRLLRSPVRTDLPGEGTNKRSTPKRGEARNYQFPPCGGTPAYFFRNAPARQPRVTRWRSVPMERKPEKKFDLSTADGYLILPQRLNTIEIAYALC